MSWTVSTACVKCSSLPWTTYRRQSSGFVIVISNPSYTLDHHDPPPSNNDPHDGRRHPRRPRACCPTKSRTRCTPEGASQDEETHGAPGPGRGGPHDGHALPTAHGQGAGARRAAQAVGDTAWKEFVLMVFLDSACVVVWPWSSSSLMCLCCSYQLETRVNAEGRLCRDTRECMNGVARIYPQ